MTNDPHSSRLNKIVAVVAALVVLGTFVLKEIVDDAIHSKVERLATSLHDFATQDQNSLLSTNLIVLEGKLEVVLAQRKPKQKADQVYVADSSIKEDTVLLKQTLVIAKSLRADAQQLINQLPGSNELLLPLQHLDSKIANIEKESDQLGKESLDLFLDDEDFSDADDPDNKRGTLKGYQLRKALMALRADLLDMTTLLSNSRQQILEQANRAREQWEHERKVYRYIGYVLFGLGWALGLISTLRGGGQSEGTG
jgi:hypothetical protein